MQYLQKKLQKPNDLTQSEVPGFVIKGLLIRSPDWMQIFANGHLSLTSNSEQLCGISSQSLPDKLFISG